MKTTITYVFDISEWDGGGNPSFFEESTDKEIQDYVEGDVGFAELIDVPHTVKIEKGPE